MLDFGGWECRSVAKIACISIALALSVGCQNTELSVTSELGDVSCVYQHFYPPSDNVFLGSRHICRFTAGSIERTTRT